jgi:putative transposase
VAENIVNRDFNPSAPHQVWTSDITYIPTREGWLYLAANMDLFSRRIVGWATSNRIDRGLALEALQRAINIRGPRPGLIHHTDRGSQYASGDFQELLKKHGMICSMSRRGNCYDNAAMESFFHSLKVEWIGDTVFETRAEARRVIFPGFDGHLEKVGYSPPGGVTWQGNDGLSPGNTSWRLSGSPKARG